MMENNKKVSLKTIYVAFNVLESYAFDSEERAKRFIKKSQTYKGEYILKQMAYAYSDELTPTHEI